MIDSLRRVVARSSLWFLCNRVFGFSPSPLLISLDLRRAKNQNQSCRIRPLAMTEPKAEDKIPMEASVDAANIVPIETASTTFKKSADSSSHNDPPLNSDDLAAALESQLRLDDTDRVPRDAHDVGAESTGDAPNETECETNQVSTNQIDSVRASAPSRLVTIADWIDQAHHVLVLTGAGVSVAAGIPDFRTPGTGLYDNLQKYQLPYAEAVFDIDYYPRHPMPFVRLAAELWPHPTDPSAPKPTLTHCFVALLAAKQKLLRNYSQNIDGLEHMAGIPTDKLIECHGHFRTARCVRCKKEASIASVQESIVTHQTPPLCLYCNNRTKKPNPPVYVKPDIVFFGEQLPPIFHRTLPHDLDQADVCLILGTSLQVPPTAHIPNMVGSTCRRILLNRELVGPLHVPSSVEAPVTGRDAFYAGDCDDSIVWIARLLGWEDELRARYKATREAK